MAAANPRPLQARPYEDHLQLPAIQIEDDEDGEYEDGGDDDMEEADGHATEANVSDRRRYGGGVVVASRTSELTLAFEGEVYVFPAVTPEKVLLQFRGSFDFETQFAKNRCAELCFEKIESSYDEAKEFCMKNTFSFLKYFFLILELRLGL